MFENLQTGEKIQDSLEPAAIRMLTGICQVIRIFSPCFFHGFISTGTLEGDLLS